MYPCASTIQEVDNRLFTIQGCYNLMTNENHKILHHLSQYFDWCIVLCIVIAIQYLYSITTTFLVILTCNE